MTVRTASSPFSRTKQKEVGKERRREGKEKEREGGRGGKDWKVEGGRDGGRGEEGRKERGEGGDRKTENELVTLRLNSRPVSMSACHQQTQPSP